MTTVHILLFSCIEINDAGDGALADRAEMVGSVGTHAAVVSGAVDTFRLVAGAFKKFGLTGIKHVLPL